MTREKLVFSTIRYRNEFDNTNELVNDKRIEDNNLTASKSNNEVIDNIKII